MTPQIRTVRDDELPAVVDALSTAFLERPDIDRVVAELRPYWGLDRTWAAFDDGRVVGTFRSWATELTVPGTARLPAGAVSGVTVLPTHRRRGVLRGMVEAEHRAMRERGEALAVLYASEYPLYGRFGYGAGGRAATWTLDARGRPFPAGEATGVELCTPDAAAVETIKGVFDAWRHRQAGEIRRRDFRWEYDLGLRESAWDGRWKGFLAIRRDAAGAVDGYVRYRAEEKWEERQPRSLLVVDELHALNDEAYAALWRYVGTMDWIATVRAERRHVAERLPWLLANARAAAAGDIGDGLWVRLLDVPRALAARTYERSARLVLEVIDAEAGDGRLRLELDAGPDGATCRPTDRSPDLTLHVSALGAAYLGGTRLRDAVVAHGADEHRPNALTEADALFRTLDEPWCSTFF